MENKEPKPVRWFSSFFEWWPTIHFVKGRSVLLMSQEEYLKKVVIDGITRYTNYDPIALLRGYLETQFWPKEAERFKIDALQLLEDYLFHPMIFVHTRTRLEMSWEEGLANAETLLLLDTMRKLSEKENDFYLSVPLWKNLEYNNKIPRVAKHRISDIIDACKDIQHYGDVCRDYVELLTFCLLENFFGSTSLFKKVRSKYKCKAKNFNQIYLKLRKVTKLAYDDSIVMFIPRIAINNFVFSPKFPEILPPLSLHDSLESFRRDNAGEIRRRFTKLLTASKEDLSTDENFENFAKRNQSEFATKMSEIYAPFNASYDVLSSSMYYRSMMYPAVILWRLIGEEYRPELTHEWLLKTTREWLLKTREEDRMSSILRFLLDFVSPPLMVMQLVQKELLTTYRTDITPAGIKDLRFAQYVTIIKYFLLSGKLICHYYDCIEECGSCILRKRVKKFKIDNPICPLQEVLGQINIRK